MEFLPTSMSTLSFTLVFAIAFMGLSMTLLFFAVRTAFIEQAQISRRLSSGASKPEGADGPSHPLAKLATYFTLPGAEEISRIRYLLSQAGYFSPNAVNVFYAVRVIAIVVPQFILLCAWGFLATKFTGPQMMLAACVLGVAGTMGPGYYVNTRKKKRTLICKEGFPDMMDLLLACIEAGLGLDAAMARVSNELERRYPPLKIALDLMNLELRAGRDRHVAMMNFANRIDLEEAQALAVMLKQSEEMGSSMGEALRTFSEDMRAKRMLLAEERALALSAKLTVPLILFIFPTIMIILLMPAGIRLAGAFS